MRLPRGARLAMLVRYLRAEAAAGRPIPAMSEIATAVGLADTNNMPELLREGQQGGFFVVHHGRNGITAIEAPDGSWRAERGREAVPQRRCLRCRRIFQPEHRTNFLCGCPEAFISIERAPAARRGA
jgi:hypothetical protein